MSAVDTRRYLDAVLGDGPGWLFVAAGTDHKVTATGKVEHGDWAERAYRWPAQVDEVLDHIAERTAAGADVYVTPSLSENPVRKLSNSTGRKEATRKRLPVPVLWVDLDADPQPDRVRHLVDRGAWRVASGSAADRHHLYVPLVEPVDADQATDLLERLAAWLGGDPAVARHGAYLRPVGSLNRKPQVRGEGPAGPVRFVDAPCEPRWAVDDLDDLLPPVPVSCSASIDLPDAVDVGAVPDRLTEIVAEPVTDQMDRSARTMAAAHAIFDAGMTPGQAVTLLRRHAPTVDKYDDRPGRLDREIGRVVSKVWRGSLTGMTTEATPCTLDQAHAVARRWLGDEYDLDALDAVLAAAAVERLDGDPLWLLVISGSGNAKTETVQALAGAGAHVTSTISSAGALLSASPRKERGKDSTGGLLRKIGERGTVVVKDVTSVLSMDRNARAEVLAALREVYDGRWERNVGTDGGRTLTWTGRVAVIGAVTTAWDQAHAVIAAMGDRFVLLRMDSTDGRTAAGRRSIRNTGHEEQMRSELAAAVGGVLADVDPSRAGELVDDEIELLLAAADLVTLARTAVEYDYRGDVIDAHAPEMPTRFAKQLGQVVRGGLAIGMDRSIALRLAIRCARDSMPPLRLEILLDLAAHPVSTTTAVRKRLDKPRATVDRQLQALHMLGLLICDEDPDHTGRGQGWRYSLADGVDPAVLDLATITRFVGNYTQEHEREGRAGALPDTNISGNGPTPGSLDRCPSCELLTFDHALGLFGECRNPDCGVTS